MCNRLSVMAAGAQVSGDRRSEDFETKVSDEILVLIEAWHLSRRRLRSMIAAKLANIRLGEVGGGHEKAGGSIDLSAAAALLNVSRTSVQRAKKLLEECSPEVIAAVEAGEKSVGLNQGSVRGKTSAKGEAVLDPRPTLKAAGKDKGQISQGQPPKNPSNEEGYSRVRLRAADIGVPRLRRAFRKQIRNVVPLVVARRSSQTEQRPPKPPPPEPIEAP